MRLAVEVVDRFVNEAAALVDAGAIRVYDATGVDLLVEIQLPVPGFVPAVNGRAHVAEIPPAVIALTGEAASATLVTASGQVVAELTIRDANASDADLADLVFDRLDFHRGGRCTVSALVLTMPRQA